MRPTSFGQNGILKLESWLAGLRYNKIISRLKKIDRPVRVVDLGCGYRGAALEKIVKFFPYLENAIGFDLSVDRNFSHPIIKLIEADLNLRLPLPDNWFDAVVSTATLEHLADQRSAVKEIYRVLKPGGYLLLTTPRDRAKLILQFLAAKLHWLDTAEIMDHKNYLTPRQLAELARQAGFREVKVKTFQLGLNIFLYCKK